MYRIDLKELASRESERVEWKENVAHINDVIATAVAFSNDLANVGGGYIVCGARETKDEHGFAKMETPGLTAGQAKEIEGRLMASCRDFVNPPITPQVEELPASTPDKRILVFIVPATPHAHSFRSKEHEAYYVRLSRETVQARNGLLRELLVKKRALDPWDKRVNASATIEDIDLLVLREQLQRMGLWDPGKALEDYLSPDVPLTAFAPPFCGREPLTGTIRPRNFALLLFGRDLQRFCGGAYAIFSVYPGTDRSEPTAERLPLPGNLFDQTRKLIDALNTQAYGVLDKLDAAPNLLKYPQRALHEAVVNALVHRDYESDQPVRVTVFSDRIEIRSPGALPSAVDREKFLTGHAAPVWRNQSLAYFFNKLHLAQGEGQGIPTILRTMSEEGCPAPIFDLETESVTCTLPAHPRHAMMRDRRAIERDIVLGNFKEAAEKARELLRRDPYDSRTIELFCEASSLMKAPEAVYEFAKELHIDKLGGTTQLKIAEMLASIRDQTESTKELARRLLQSAASGHFQEAEARKLVVSLRKIGDNHQAIDVLNRLFTSNPNLKNSSSLLQLRGKSYIDFAKRCTETAKNRSSPPRIKARAWEECRRYLEEAERDLHHALEHVVSPADREYILRDLEFLAHMKKIARKPTRYR
ncbi:uncharacterized protein SOCE26_102090 [Sorangium cellulosum]|uniref:Schlafen AlbA-2 domain-containing protein n=1 Tax=Sorangium cellulosum TaxID=56 RepID=A0A2L0FAN7_SORCE|nr:ATP-binding protein [Sorangium cellulosum]AUX48668.1 uncharacterized protein SOCE26_102090 [Sorangium cellulosum]